MLLILLSADRWRVKLKNDSPNYIHASFVNVSISKSVTHTIGISKRLLWFQYFIIDNLVMYRAISKGKDLL